MVDLTLRSSTDSENQVTKMQEERIHYPTLLSHANFDKIFCILTYFHVLGVWHNGIIISHILWLSATHVLMIKRKLIIDMISSRWKYKYFSLVKIVS